MGTCLSRDPETLSCKIRKTLRLLWTDLQYFNKYIETSTNIESTSFLFFKDPSIRVKLESLKNDFQELAHVSTTPVLHSITRLLCALYAIFSYIHSTEPRLNNFKWYLQVFLEESSKFM